MQKTLFAGLTQLSPGESLSSDDFSFQDRNPELIDRLLEIGAVTHRHDAHAPQDDPTVEPSGSVDPSGGTIAADQVVYLGYTLLDYDNGETVISPLITLATQPGLEPPEGAPTVEIDYTAGDLLADTYYYAVTLLDESGGETPLGDSEAVEREPGFASGRVLVSGMSDLMNEASAAGWRLWRATGGGEWHCMASGTGDTYEDAGLTEGDCTIEPPDDSENTTNSTGALLVTVPSGGVMDTASGYAVYGSVDGDFSGPSLLGQYPAASAGTEHTYTQLDFDDPRPPDVSTSIPGASMIDPDTELLDWHWKRPVATLGDLPSGDAAEEGDVRVVMSVGVPYWATADGGPWQELIGNADIAIGNVAASGDGEAGPASALMFVGEGGLTAEVEEASGSAIIRLSAPGGGGGGDLDLSASAAPSTSEALRLVRATDGQIMGVILGWGDALHSLATMVAVASGAQSANAEIAAQHGDEPWDDANPVRVQVLNYPDGAASGLAERQVRIIMPLEGGSGVATRTIFDSKGESDFNLGVSYAPTRQEFNHTTGVLASGAVEESAFIGASIYRLWRIETDQAARVRIYTDATRQAADAARAIGTDPTGDHGCLFDFVTTPGDLDWVLTPQVDGVTLDESSDVPITVTNLDASAAVTVTLYAIV